MSKFIIAIASFLKNLGPFVIISTVLGVVMVVGGLTSSIILYNTFKAEQERIEDVEVLEVEIIPFDKQTVEDPNMLQGQTDIQQEGIDGEKTITYLVTRWVHKDQSEISRVLVGEEVTVEPVPEITAIGTKVVSNNSGGGGGSTSTCNPSYTLWGYCDNYVPSDEMIMAECTARGGKLEYYAYAYDENGNLINGNFAGKFWGCEFGNSRPENYNYAYGKAAFWREIVLGLMTAEEKLNL